MAEQSMIEQAAAAWSKRRSNFYFSGDLHSTRIFDKSQNDREVFVGSTEEAGFWMDRQCARAAIEAMRQPTEQMINEGYDAERQGYPDEPGYCVAPADCWRAMIDAALSEQP